MVRQTAQKHKCAVVLVDMSPSVGSLNHNILIQSDYFIVPTSPDFFCLMAIDSLARVLPNWAATAKLLRASQTGATYKIPNGNAKFIGMISQRYRPRRGQPASNFLKWIERIVNRVNTALVPALQKEDMTISSAQFESVVGKGTKFELARVADFNSLIAQSQEHATPIFALSDQQLERVGVVLEQMQESRDSFEETFQDLATNVRALVNL
jgi:chromosome partitioning protein